MHQCLRMGISGAAPQHRSTSPRYGMRLLRRALVAAAVLLAGVTGTAVPAQAATPFKVLAFYNGTWDAAHIDFDKEARDWFPKAGAQYGFTWEATTDWSRLNASRPAG